MTLYLLSFHSPKAHKFQALYRFVLVKYATKGLVQDGRVSPLFSRLYCLCSVSFLTLHLLRTVAFLNLDINTFVKQKTPILDFYRMLNLWPSI